MQLALALTLTAPAVKVGSRVARYCWQVIAAFARLYPESRRQTL
jgi:hypothetical protein